MSVSKIRARLERKSVPLPETNQSYLTPEQMQGFDAKSVLDKINGVTFLNEMTRSLLSAAYGKIRTMDYSAINFELEMQRNIVHTINANYLTSEVQHILHLFREAPNDSTSVIISCAVNLNLQMNAIPAEYMQAALTAIVSCIQHYAQDRPANFMYS